MGLLMGAALTPEWHGRAREFLTAGLDQGVMVLVAGPNVIRFAPALNISEPDLAEALTRFGKAVDQVVAK